MSAFHEKSFAQRFSRMGDEAEGVFEAVWPTKFARHGLCRPECSLSKVPAFIRCTPDYLVHDGLVEVKGCGRDQKLKLKTWDEAALMDWDQIFPVRIFIWDSYQKRWAVSALKLISAALDGKPLEAYHDGPEYRALPLAEFPATWTPYDPKTAQTDGA